MRVNVVVRTKALHLSHIIAAFAMHHVVDATRRTDPSCRLVDIKLVNIYGGCA